MRKRLFCALLVTMSLLFCACGESAPAEAEPSPTPTPTPALSRAEEKLASMSLEEKVWQMLFVFPEDIVGECSCGDGAAWTEALAARPAGGICFVGDNIVSEAELRAMTEAISGAGFGVFLGLDEEGGKVARLSYSLGTTTDFKPMYEYRSGGTTAAFENARTIAEDIASFGFNMDFAPVADVWTNPGNTVIGRRAYSDDPAEAAELVAAAVQGFHAGGVLSVLKHFPGHGDTLEDSHYAAAHSGKTAEEMRSCEFLPFSSGIGAGCGAVMVGHIIAEKIDPGVPATLSRKIVTELLRGELGFDGVVITDAFDMAGLGDLEESEAVVRAIEAGCDMILAPADPDAAARAIIEDVSEERIDESVLRILELKYGFGIIKSDLVSGR